MRKIFKNQGLGKLTVRARYYFEYHKVRWERRYKIPYPEHNGIFGTMSGIRWING